MKDMETIEEIYAGMLEEHELVLAARRQERIKAANPYGCNQYGHRKGHGGSSSGGGSSKQSDTKKQETEKASYKKEYSDTNEFVRDAKSALKRGKLKQFIENTKWVSVDEDEYHKYYFIKEGEEGIGIVVPKDGEPYIITEDSMFTADDDENDY